MTIHRREPPVRDYDEMTGWPGTIPPARLRRAILAIREGTPLAELDQETRADMIGMAHCYEANMVSSQDPTVEPPPVAPSTASSGAARAGRAW